ncbi:TetR/AcrR family transcriptional regulator [Congregibacter litoralis]|uniref:Transcriptional regulator n=1 Tax=Congregibacter litoralis KT71 TaxID=314285 RepID=A4A3N6_9GAMM|nr:TetR/AcrR family transcriptional regulator [Congregibacter litoralis]EAQ99309.1 Transcriptional regulator [Congregibacter litoralis KT71]
MTQAASQRAYHHGNLRAELLAEAAEQLRHTPAEQLSLRAVARSLGVSQTAPYRHFSGKEALLAAIATRGYRELLALLGAARDAGSESAAKQLRLVARAYVDFAASQEQIFKLMFGPLVQPSDDYPELRAVSRETLLLVQSILQFGMENGEFEKQDALYLANASWAGIHGVATLRVDTPSLFSKHVDLLRQIDVSVNAFINGIRRRDHETP